MGQLNKQTRRLDDFGDGLRALVVFRDAARLEIAALKERVRDLEQDRDGTGERLRLQTEQIDWLTTAVCGSWRRRREARRALR